MHLTRYHISICLVAIVTLWFCSCRSHQKESPAEASKPTFDLEQIVERGELRVATIIGAESYYIHGKVDMSKDYLMAVNFADYIDVPLRLVVAPDVEALKDSLERGLADFAAYNVVCSKKNQENFRFVNWNIESLPVLIQQKKKRHQITSATQLVGKTVYVKSQSKHLRRMKHLNWEIGGGILIEEASDSISTEDLINMVSKGEIEYAVADNDVALRSMMHFRNVDCSLPLGTHTTKAWIVRADAPKLCEKLNAWHDDPDNKAFFAKLERKSKQNGSSGGGYVRSVHVPPPTPEGAISPYDDIIRKNAELIGWDWRLLAALIYTESKFNCNVVSRQGALGLMQMMPSTARKYGLNNTTALDPAANIAAGVKYINALSKAYSHISNPNERAKFILASYNSGGGHVADAVRLAKKYGANPNVWNGNVEKYLLLKSEPAYYNDEVCKSGYFRAAHTVRYVNHIFAVYERYKSYTKTTDNTSKEQ